VAAATSASSRTRRRTRRPRAEREAEILLSAREVFAERGYAATAVAEIATRAGVVEGTVYSYFPTKRALLIRVMRGFYESLIADTEAGLRAVRGSENRLRFLIRRQLDAFTSDLGLCRVVLREARPDPDLYDDAILDLNRRYTGLALGVLEDGVASGELREDLVPGVIRDLLYGGIEHAVWRFVFGGGELDANALADQLADAILGGILAPESPSVRREPVLVADTVARLERAVSRLEASVVEATPGAGA